VCTNTQKASGGIRDRAILELLYSTGIRRNELCNLEIVAKYIAQSRLTLYVKNGKGGKDRLLPLGERAALWIKRYLQDVTPAVIDEHQ
jgi:integrase/recombinase XerD